MPSPKENTKPITDYIKAIGGWCVNIHGSVFAIGIPDVLACIEGRFYGIEVKRARGGRLSRLQMATLAKIEQAGGIGISITNVAELRQVINNVGHGSVKET